MAWLEKFWFGCGHCHGGRECPLAEQAESALPAGGQSATVPAVLVVFILPLATAIAGAHVCGPSGLWQTAGALGGLMAGVVVARLLWWCVAVWANGRGSGRRT